MKALTPPPSSEPPAREPSVQIISHLVPLQPSPATPQLVLPTPSTPAAPLIGRNRSRLGDPSQSGKPIGESTQHMDDVISQTNSEAEAHPSKLT